MGKKWFSLGEISKYHIIAFLIPVFNMLTTYVQRDEIIENEGDKQNEFNEEYEFPYLINNIISKLFSGILCLISKYIINKRELPSSLRRLKIYHLNVNSKNKLKILLYIIVISVLEVIYLIENIKTLKIKGLIESKLGFTIFVPIFSFFLLKTKYYRHHFVSIAITLFGFIFVIFSLFFPTNDENNTFKDNLRHFLFSIPYSFSFVLIKHMFMHYFIDSFMFLFLDGIFCLLFSFFYIFIKLLIFYQDGHLFAKNIKNMFFMFENLRIFSLFLCILFFSFLYYLTKVATLYLFSPTLMVMTDILSPILTYIIDCIVKRIFNYDNIDERQSVLKGIGYIFFILASIIFNEIIICNFWQLNYNTNIQIEIRGIEDALQKSDTKVLSRSDTIMSTNI